MRASMVVRNAVFGARSTSGSTSKRWRFEQLKSPAMKWATPPCCPNFSTRSHPTKRSPASRLTAPTTRASATMQLPNVAQPPSFHLARTPSLGRPIAQGRLPATRRFRRRDTWAVRCGDDGVDTTAEAASKRRCTASNCSVSALWRFGIGLEPEAARCLTFDRQVAEFQVRVAVLNGFTALGIPVTKVVG
jgi:hypothetical protein